MCGGAAKVNTTATLAGVGHWSTSWPMLAGLAGVRRAGAVPSCPVIKAEAMADAAVGVRWSRLQQRQMRLLASVSRRRHRRRWQPRRRRRCVRVLRWRGASRVCCGKSIWHWEANDVHAVGFYHSTWSAPRSLAVPSSRPPVLRRSFTAENALFTNTPCSSVLPGASLSPQLMY